MEIPQLQESIRTFSLEAGPRGNQGYSRVLLQIFGYTGHGKSAFINSCKYVVDDGEFIEHAKAADSQKEGPETMERKAYDLTKNVTMVDNRGGNTMDSFQRAEIYAQLGNFLPIGEKVEWMKTFIEMMHRLEDAETNPNYTDFIAPILICSAETKLMSDDNQAMKEFVKNCVDMTGVVPIVVITKKTSGDFTETEKMFKLMGAENIISIENYTEKDHIKTRGRTKDILTVLHSALEDVKYRLGEERNPQADWRQRKKFMLEYIHKAEMEKQEEGREGIRNLHEFLSLQHMLTRRIHMMALEEGMDEMNRAGERRGQEDRNPHRNLALLDATPEQEEEESEGAGCLIQ